MKINIKFTDTDSDDTLREYAEEKVASFGKLLGDEELEAAICNIEFRHSTHHQSGDVCTAEVTLEAGGKLYRSAKDEPRFEKAIDKVKDDILAALRSDKQKTKHKFIKGATEIKERLRGEE
jgi:ribosome-associated translation inhibitor RaiA